MTRCFTPQSTTAADECSAAEQAEAETDKTAKKEKERNDWILVDTDPLKYDGTRLWHQNVIQIM